MLWHLNLESHNQHLSKKTRRHYSRLVWGTVSHCRLLTFLPFLTYSIRIKGNDHPFSFVCVYTPFHSLPPLNIRAGKQLNNGYHHPPNPRSLSSPSSSSSQPEIHPGPTR
ncbi:hypothetical protein VTJ04DRAFT_4435 [Mycothermus thermophilus]|uniref:uncharacterized protein n=1 Tax=Humicola insolens TaxID=85995 RepID=UPI003743EA01